MDNENWRSEKEDKEELKEIEKKYYKWRFITLPLLCVAMILIVVLFTLIWFFIKGLI